MKNDPGQCLNIRLVVKTVVEDAFRRTIYGWHSGLDWTVQLKGSAEIDQVHALVKELNDVI